LTLMLLPTQCLRTSSSRTTGYQNIGPRRARSGNTGGMLILRCTLGLETRFTHVVSRHQLAVSALPDLADISIGEPDPSIPLPETADLVQCDEDQCDDLAAYMGTISPKLGSAPIKTKQACYLPRHMRFGEERSPLVGETSVPGLYIASGHTCWGIQNGPGTGCLMAELLLDGKTTSANIEKLDPKKYKV
jgi:glycine/D-amino acid oxidase-like deaminating enzyme